MGAGVRKSPRGENPKFKTKNPKQIQNSGLAVSNFEFRVLNLFRIFGFEFRFYLLSASGRVSGSCADNAGPAPL
jgi:hypothetical protein